MWILLAAAPLAGAQTAPAPSAAPPAAAPSIDDTSYTFGLTFGGQLRSVGITDELNTDAVMRGLKDGLKGKKTTQADNQQLQAYVRTVLEASANRNTAAAKEFLAKNTHEKGILTTASGLQYKVMTAGDPKAAAINSTDEVTVNYKGKLLDGSEFDSSYVRGQPATFPISGIIQGWQEALVMMKPGAKWQLFVPPELGYGGNPKPGIPGGSLLIFEVEVLSVKPAAAQAAPAAPAPAAKVSHKPAAPKPAAPKSN